VIVCSECGRDKPDDSRFCNSCAEAKGALVLAEQARALLAEAG
jgi:uncharacterized membrane protein YvbJ